MRKTVHQFFRNPGSQESPGQNPYLAISKGKQSCNRIFEREAFNGIAEVVDTFRQRGVSLKARDLITVATRKGEFWSPSKPTICTLAARVLPRRLLTRPFCLIQARSVTPRARHKRTLLTWQAARMCDELRVPNTANRKPPWLRGWIIQTRRGGFPVE